MPCHICESDQLVDLFRYNGRRYLQCARCGLIAQEGIRAAGAAAKYRSDRYQQQQAPHQLQLREALFNHLLDELAQRRTAGRLPFDPAKPGRLLDVGCGDGLFLKLAAGRGWQCHGVELSPQAAEEARRQLLPAGQAGGGRDDQIICSELGQSHYSSGYFDVVTLLNVLDQVAAPLDQLREIHRILKPGGLLLLRVPNAAFHVTLLRLRPALGRQLIVHLYSFSAATLRALLERAGYQQITVTNSPLTPGDPYGASPFLGEWGMAWIKRVVYGAVQATALFSGRRLLLGPSLMAYAVKPRSAG